MKRLYRLSLLAALLATLSCSRSGPGVPPATVIEKQLAPSDIAISIDRGDDQGELVAVPETVRIRFKNRTAQRGYFELPGPLRDVPQSEYRAPSLAIGLRQHQGDGGAGSEPIFLYSPSNEKRPARASAAILEPSSSVEVAYPLAEFCLIGHGIASDPAANLRACFKPGNVKMELRVYLISDWEKMQKEASDPVAAKLSEPDVSMHRDLRRAVE